MKTLKTIGLLLLLATGVLAQPNPNDMFIDGYVLDVSGQAIANHQVCVSYVSNNPSLPSDSVCTTTNANGYYFINITNGSLTGPNVTFEISTYDPCAFLPLVETRENYQGSIDTANVNFAICATNTGCNGLAPVITTTIDTTNGSWNYVFSAGATGGTAPYTYQWGGVMVNQIGQTVTYQAAPNEVFDICLTVVDANGCSASTCDTVYVGGNSGQNCSVNITTTVDSTGGGLVYTLYAPTGYCDYLWSDGSTGQVTTISNVNPNNNIICLTVSDCSGNCTATTCDTLLPINSGNCFADFWYQTNNPNTPVNAGDTVGFSYTGSVAQYNYYFWTVQGMGLSLTSYDPNPSFTFPLAGAYEVCVEVYDSLANCSDTYCETVTVGTNSCYGYISGQIYAGSNNQPLDEGVVYLITFDANTNQLTAVDSMVVDSGNYYFFGPLACGDYLIKAAAYPGSQYYTGHVPTYYGNSPFWSFAQTATLGQVNTQVSADIFLIAANNPGGPGFIGGDVTQGANKTDPGDPLEGMQVILLDQNDNAIAYTYTDANGQFGFSNLAYGTYKVYVEKLGAATEAAYVTIGPDQPSVDDVHIFASETEITTGIKDFDFEGSIGEVYPNPVGADASINFNLEAEVIVNISVLDLTGRTISTASRTISSGENLVRLDLDGLTDGYYFLNIQDLDGAFSITRKFMRVD